MHIVDRRLNPSGKSLENRQRFLRRAKALVQQAVRSSSRLSSWPVSGSLKSWSSIQASA